MYSPWSVSGGSSCFGITRLAPVLLSAFAFCLSPVPLLSRKWHQDFSSQPLLVPRKATSPPLTPLLPPPSWEGPKLSKRSRSQGIMTAGAGARVEGEAPRARFSCHCLRRAAPHPCQEHQARAAASRCHLPSRRRGTRLHRAHRPACRWLPVNHKPP